MPKQELSTVHKTGEGKTVRAVIPIRVAEKLGLEDGDTLAWYTEEKGGKIYAIAKKAEL